MRPSHGRLRMREWPIMRTISPSLHEQRKIEFLLTKLATVKPVSAKPAPIVRGERVVAKVPTAHPKVFFST